MLHIFYVNIGVMLKFEMNLAIQSVLKLKEAILKKMQIAVEKQVLLISGGEWINDPERKVCSYNAGNDSNPFFLFNLDLLKKPLPPFELPNFSTDKQLERNIQELLNKPATFEVVTQRKQIVQAFSELAHQRKGKCQELVHSQHLQHQGWSAVIANMLEVMNIYEKKTNIVANRLTEFISQRDEHVNLIEKFPSAVELLKKIPVFPCLPYNSTDSSPSQSSSSSSFPPSTSFNSILDWIAATHFSDTKFTLEESVEICKKGLQECNKELLQKMWDDLNKMIELVVIDKKEAKKIKGLEDRLSGLEKLMANVQKVASEQDELAKMFTNFEMRVKSLQDSSMLPDVCSSHNQYLDIVLSNHQILVDAVQKCTKAKYELCENLHNRLNWLMVTEQSIASLDSKVKLIYITLNNLKRRFLLLDRIIICPSYFCKTVTEVVRRKKFAKHFLNQAGKMSSSFTEMHEMEMKKRKEFDENVPLEKHFLQLLFPGIFDKPPRFAMKCPTECDTALPDIKPEDIVHLSNSLPTLTSYLRVESSTSEVHELTLMVTDGTSDATAGDVTTAATDTAAATSTNKVISTCTSNDAITQTEINFAYFAEATDKLHSDSPLSQSFEMLHRKTSTNKLTQLSPPAPTTTITTSLSTTSTLTTTTITTTTETVSSMLPTSKLQQQQQQQQQQSPMGTSQEYEDAHNDGFSTADFYFDESMHSSATTDPASSKKDARILELQALLQDRDKEFNKLNQNMVLGEKEDLLKMCGIQLQDALSQIEHLNKQVKVLRENVEDNEKEIREKDELYRKASKDKDLIKAELEEKINFLILENEVELGKLKYDYHADLQLKDNAIAELETKNKFMEEKLKSCVKPDVMKKMQDEFTMKLNDQQRKVRSDLKEEYEQISECRIAEIECQHRSNMNLFCNQLRNLCTELNSLRQEIWFNEYNDSLKSGSTEVLSFSTGKDYSAELSSLIPDLFAECSDALKFIREDNAIDRSKFNKLKDKKVCMATSSTPSVGDLAWESKNDAARQPEHASVESNNIEMAEHQMMLEKKIAQLKEEHLEYVLKLEEDHKKRHDETVERMEKERRELRERITVENEEGRQVSFNLALRQATKARDEHIKRLESSIIDLKEKLKKYGEVPSDGGMPNDAESEQNLDLPLAGAQRTIEDLEQQIMRSKSSDVVVNQPTTTQAAITSPLIVNRLTMDQSIISQSVDQSTFERIFQLEDNLKNTKQENKKLKDQLMKLNMSQSSRKDLQNNVNVTSCNVGSITLFVLDQQTGHYVAYLTSSNNKHFLHVDSLEGLGLSSTEASASSSSSLFKSSSPTSSTSVWIVAEVTEREQCQVKKSNNRFMLPVGTRFYRVKAKPWNPDTCKKTGGQKS